MNKRCILMGNKCKLLQDMNSVLASNAVDRDSSLGYRSNKRLYK